MTTPPTPTPDQKTIKEITQFLNQHCDGFLLVAFHPANQHPMTAVSAVDPKVEIALNAFINNIMANGGVGFVREQIKAAQKQEEE